MPLTFIYHTQCYKSFLFMHEVLTPRPTRELRPDLHFANEHGQKEYLWSQVTLGLVRRR